MSATLSVTDSAVCRTVAGTSPLTAIPEHKLFEAIGQTVAAAFHTLLIQERNERAQLDTAPSALGHKTLQTLRLLGTLREFQSDEPAGEAVLVAAQQALLTQCKTEAELVKLITPALWRLRVGESDGSDACSVGEQRELCVVGQHG